MSLYEMANQVDSKESFLAFVRALADDAATAATEAERTPEGKLNLRPGGWEQSTIADFLYTMDVWGAGNYGMTGEPHVPAEPSWRAFAKLLHSGKFYEGAAGGVSLRISLCPADGSSVAGKHAGPGRARFSD